MSQVETPKAEEPKAETPKVETPKADETPVVPQSTDTLAGVKPLDGQAPTEGDQKVTPPVKEGAAQADGAAKPEGEKPAVPVAYTLTAPDGMDAEEVEAFKGFAKQHNLTNEQAQVALDSLPDALASQVSRFRADVEKHPEVGGDKLEASVALGLKALDTFLPASEPEGAALRRGLNVSGYGNYAPLVLLLARIGKALGEDGGVGNLKAGGGTEKGVKKDAAELLYGGTSPN